MASKTNIILFSAILLLLGAFLFILPPDPDASRYENRAMAGPPAFSVGEFLSGRFSDSLEEYMSDRFAYRTRFLSFSATLENAYGIRLGGATLVPMDYDDFGTGLVADPDIVFIDPPALDKAGSPGGEGSEGGTGAAGDSGIAGGANGADGEAGVGSEPESSKPGADINFHPDAVFYGGFYINGDSVARYIEVLDLYHATLPDSVRVFSLLAPTKVEFMDEKYREGSAMQGPTIRNIYGRLNEDIITVDAYSRIAAPAQDEYLYFRTDHHWTALGAYYAYLAYAEAAGLEPIPLSDYVEFALPGFIGSYAPGTQEKIILDHPDTLYYYLLDTGVTFSRSLILLSEDPAKLGYMVFLGGDAHLLDYKSSNENGRALIVIKDSYANAIVPWLAPHYERTLVVDPRLYGGSVRQLIADLLGQSADDSQAIGSQDEARRSNLQDIDVLFMTTAQTPSLPGFVEQIADIR